MDDTKIEFRDNCIDLIRLIAAVTVMFSHSLRWFEVSKPVWGLWFTDGSVGVIAFNVLSGFLIFASWERCKKTVANPKNAIKKYAINRIFRIYPALIASCLFIIVLDFMLRSGDLLINYKTPIKILMYCVAALGAEPIKDGYSNGVLWTLFNELLLYCVIPVFYNCLKKLSKKQWGILISSCWLLNWMDRLVVNIPQTSKVIGILGGGGFFPLVMYEYLIGIFIYCYMNEIIPILKNIKFLICSTLVWATLYFVIAFSGLISQFWEMHCPLFGIILPWIVVGFAYKFRLNLKFDISYGIYLFHMPVVYSMIDITNKNANFLPIVWVLVIVVAFLSCICVERPFMKLKKTLLSKLL